MKTLNTIAGNVYVITSKNGGTVTDATGTLSEPIEAGKQVHITAPSDMLLIDDEEAILRPANFKKARLALRMLGAGSTSGSILPPGYTRLEYLESAGASYIETDIQAASNIGLKIRCSFVKTSNNNYVFYNATPFVSYIGIAESAIRVRRVGTYNVSLPLTTEQNELTLNYLNSRTVTVNGEVKQPASSIVTLGAGGENVRFFNKGTTSYVKLYAAEVTNGDSVVCNLIPCLSAAGKPAMHDATSGTTYVNVGTGEFVAGVGTVAQLNTLLSRLAASPTRSASTLTLSLPAEANTPEVAEQLQACQERTGMTLTVYEYRPAAVTTYALRRVRNMVWCRVKEDADGNYTNFIGERFNIERCAAIFGPLGSDPTAYGYEPFDSAEQAAEEFGLIPYEYPEEENLI